MRSIRTQIACRAALLAALALPVAQLRAQTQPPAFHREVIVIDPAHGGADTGARIDDQVSEKEVTLALATRLRSLLAARGFTVISTRQDDTTVPGSTDQRAELANKSHAVACLVLHASASGNGVFIGSSMIGSSLAVPAVADTAHAAPSPAVSWERAQEVYISQSLRLANQIGAALTRSNIPVALGRPAVRPLDNLMCPAILVEIGTLRPAGADPSPVSDSGYQQRVADAIAGALVFWRNQAQQPDAIPANRPGAQLLSPEISPNGYRFHPGTPLARAELDL